MTTSMQDYDRNHKEDCDKNDEDNMTQVISRKCQEERHIDGKRLKAMIMIGRMMTAMAK